jgi:stage IV sporulation protein FB
VTVGRIMGVPVRLHPSLLIVLGLFLVAGHGWAMVLAFLSILGHELAHVVMGEALDVHATQIELWPFGGRAELGGLDGREPAVQGLVALSGPLSSGLFAIAGALLTRAMPYQSDLQRFFVAVNAGLALFNLLPAAPLDGGRVLRALRSRTLGYGPADLEVRRFGFVLAVAMAAAALIVSAFGTFLWPLAAVAVFLYWASRQPRHQRLWAIRDMAVRVAEVARRPVWALEDLAVHESAPLSMVLDVMHPRELHRVAVFGDHLEILGVVWERDILRALQEQGPAFRVGALLGPPHGPSRPN